MRFGKNRPHAHRRNRRSGAGAAVCLLLLVAGSAGGAVAATSGAGIDAESPVVLVLPPKAATERDDVVVRARVLDPSGVGSVVLHARGEGQADFQAFPMAYERDDEYVARIPASDERGLEVAYFVEATDALGNGPRISGSSRSPYVARVEPVPVSTAELQSSPWKFMAALVPLLPILFAVWFFVRRKQQRDDRAFWIGTLTPVLDLDGSELMSAMDDVCSKIHQHPRRGHIRVDKGEAYEWLRTLRGPAPEQLLAEAQVETEPVVVQTQGASPLEQLAEDIFWLHLLLPVAELRGRKADDALQALVGRPHAHPEGTRTYDKRTLRKKLRWVKEADANEVFDRWRVLNAAGQKSPPVPADAAEMAVLNQGAAAKPAPRAGQRGLSLVELLAVIAFMAVIIGIGSLYLKPLEAPLQTGGEMLEGLLKQTRAKAMATTTVHRVRPVDDHSLVVESADACSSGTWTLDPRLELDLPQDVTLSQTTWSVCFNSRGIASNNIVLTLNHPQFGTRQLEVLMGGTVRWVP